MTFINLSNHPSGKWSKIQIDAANEYGEIIDMPFPMISAKVTDEELNQMVDDYYNRIVEHEVGAVMLQGEYVFTYRLIVKLKAAGIKVLASYTERRVVEEVREDGTTVKNSEFVFMGFREY